MLKPVPLAAECLLSAVFRAWAVTAATVLDGEGRRLLQDKQWRSWKNGKGQVEDDAQNRIEHVMKHRTLAAWYPGPGCVPEVSTEPGDKDQSSQPG